jgi:ABC-2 type transport system ATP-binding protein
MDAIEIRGVTKTFGDVAAVDGLSLTVPPGAVYGFIGPNGSGKTTTMRMVVNILYSDQGLSLGRTGRLIEEPVCRPFPYVGLTSREVLQEARLRACSAGKWRMRNTSR